MITAVWSESLWGLRKTVLATNVEESDRAMAADSTTKALVSPPPRCVSAPKLYSCVLHDSDHDGVVRIFVRHPNHLNELFTLINYLFTRHNFSPTRSVIWLLVTPMHCSYTEKGCVTYLSASTVVIKECSHKCSLRFLVECW